VYRLSAANGEVLEQSRPWTLVESGGLYLFVSSHRRTWCSLLWSASKASSVFVAPSRGRSEDDLVPLFDEKSACSPLEYDATIYQCLVRHSGYGQPVQHKHNDEVFGVDQKEEGERK